MPGPKGINMTQACSTYEFLKDKSEFNQIKRNNDVRLEKSCKESNLKKYEEKRRALETTNQHLWAREDGSKLTDKWEIVDDHKVIPVINAEKKNQ